jgi:hypothetical protein
MPDETRDPVTGVGKEHRANVSIRGSSPMWPHLVILLSVGIALRTTYRIARKMLLLGSVEGHFVYAYGHALEGRVWFPFLIVFAPACGLAWLTTRKIATRERACVLAWWAAAFPSQLVLRVLAFEPLEASIRSDSSNSFYTPTLSSTALDFLGNFQRQAEALPMHAAANMPGKVLLYYLLETMTSAPQVMGYANILLSNLGGVFLYFIVRDLFGDRRTALYSLILYLFIPGRTYFFPLANTVTPTVVLACLFLHVRFLVTGRSIYALGLGVGLYVMLLFDPIPLATGPIFVAAFLNSRLPTCNTPAAAIRTASRATLLGAAAFVAVYATVLVSTGFDIAGCFWTVLANAQDFNAQNKRDYTLWAMRNPVDFCITAGVAVVPLALAAVLEAARSPVQLRALATFGIATVLAFVALDAAGVNRGEVMRLWIFQAAFFAVLAAWTCARVRGSLTFYLVLGVNILQAAVGLDVVRFL